MRPFPWREAIGFGLGVLRLSPDAFWNMTPRELAFAIAAVRSAQPHAPERATLDQLMRQYPDQAGHEKPASSPNGAMHHGR